MTRQAFSPPPSSLSSRVSNVAQLLISSQRLSSLSSSVRHPHAGGKTVSSVCLSHRKVVSGRKKRRRRRWRRRTLQGNLEVTARRTGRRCCLFRFNLRNRSGSTVFCQGGEMMRKCVFLLIISLISLSNSQRGEMIKMPSTAVKLASC